MNSGVTVQRITGGWYVCWTPHEKYYIVVRDVTRMLFRDLGLWEAKFCVHVNGSYQTLTVNSISYEQAPIAMGEWLNDFDLLGVIVDTEADAHELKDLLDQRISWAILSDGRPWS
jgi:hypothetical protein